MTQRNAQQIRQLLSELLLGRFDWARYCQPLPSLPNTDILRLDQVHPLLQGNKALKLAGWWQRFEPGTYRKILTFGGCWSNHLHASAAFAYALDIPLTCLVRGYSTVPLTPTLQDCANWGADLVFLNKQEYARRYDSGYQEELAQLHDALVIPEGGAGEAGELACFELARFVQHYDECWLAAGSGTTALGIARGLQALRAKTRLVAVNAVADKGELDSAWQHEMPAGVAWQVIDGALGGFARQTPELQELIERYQALGLPLDRVYTGKLMLAYERAAQGEGKKTLLIHSGGLQGNRSV